MAPARLIGQGRHLAVEEFAAASVPVRSLAVADDIASAPPPRAGERLGIAGDLFVFNVAGAAAELGRDVDGVHTAAKAALARTRSTGVALSACSLPQRRAGRKDDGRRLVPRRPRGPRRPLDRGGDLAAVLAAGSTAPGPAATTAATTIESRRGRSVTLGAGHVDPGAASALSSFPRFATPPSNRLYQPP